MKLNQDCISAWPFCDAPKELQALSEHDGEEDWLAYVPKAYADVWIPWLDTGSSFGTDEIFEYEFKDGKVFIGVHS